MAKTTFLFLLSSHKIDQKMTKQIGGGLFFFYGLHLNSAATPQQNGKDLFLGLVFT